MIDCFLIDDDMDDQEIFLLALRQLDPKIGCSLAMDAVDAMEKLADPAFRPSIIFLDLNMPRMGGVEFLAKMKGTGTLDNIPVIIYSTSDEEVFKKETAALGAKGYLVKTSTFDALIDQLKNILQTIAGHTI